MRAAFIQEEIADFVARMQTVEPDERLMIWSGLLMQMRPSKDELCHIVTETERRLHNGTF